MRVHTAGGHDGPSSDEPWKAVARRVGQVRASWRRVHCGQARVDPALACLRGKHYLGAGLAHIWAARPATFASEPRLLLGHLQPVAHYFLKRSAEKRFE